VNIEESKLGSEVNEKRGREGTTLDNIHILKVGEIPNRVWNGASEDIIVQFSVNIEETNS
jgi:hypothetical protein